jgi:hypothetical protein
MAQVRSGRQTARESAVSQSTVTESAALTQYFGRAAADDDVGSQDEE